MKKLITLSVLCFIFFSCKKDKTTTPPTVTPSSTTEQLTPQFQLEYGGANDNAHMAMNPVTVLASGNLIIATVQYNGANDQLVITKTNANGGILWQKNLATTYGMLARHLKQHQAIL